MCPNSKVAAASWNVRGALTLGTATKPGACHAEVGRSRSATPNVVLGFGAMSNSKVPPEAKSCTGMKERDKTGRRPVASCQRRPVMYLARPVNPRARMSVGDLRRREAQRPA